MATTKKPIDKSYLEHQFSEFYNYIKDDDDISNDDVVKTIKVNNVAQTVSNNTVNIQVNTPTKLSDLTNDMNVVTDSNYVHTDNNFTNSLKSKLENISTNSNTNSNTTSSMSSKYTKIDDIVYDLGCGYNYGNVYEAFSGTISMPAIYNGTESTGTNKQVAEIYDNNWKFYSKITSSDNTSQSTSKVNLGNTISLSTSNFTLTKTTKLKNISIRPYNSNLTAYNGSIVPLKVEILYGSTQIYNNTNNFELTSAGQVKNYLSVDVSSYNIIPNDMSNPLTIKVYFTSNSQRPDYESYDYYDGDVFQNNIKSYNLWGNVPLTNAFVLKIKEYGYKTIRIPVTWSNHVTRDGKIHESWFEEVKKAVDLVLDNGLYCVLNMHHDTGTKNWLRANASNSTALINAFNSLWNQILDIFGEDYNDTKLILEGFNEIINTSNQWLPSLVNSADLEFVDILNQNFVDLARSKGYKGWLCCNSYAAASYDTLVPPTDTLNRTMLQYHVYRDYFTDDVWKEKIKLFAKKYSDYVIMLGEFGWRAYTEDDSAQNTTSMRVSWMNSGVKCFRELNNVVPVIWDDGGNNSDTYVPHNYGLINKRTGVCFSDYVNIVNAMINTWNDNIYKWDNYQDIIQADWNQIDSTASDYIKNKPTIPTSSSTTDIFDGKTIAFFGDSIGAGSGWRANDGITEPLSYTNSALETNMRGWAKAFKENHANATVKNYSTYGSTIAYNSSGGECLYNQLSLMETQNVTPDYIVLQGGANDAIQQITIGDISADSNRDVSSLDATKTIPCFEMIISTLLTKYPSAKIIYMTNPRMYVASDYAYIYTGLDAILKKMKAVCEKWSIPVLDMEHTCPLGSINPSYKNNSTYYAEDKMHPLAKFYRESVYQIESALVSPIQSINATTNTTVVNNTTVNNTGTGLDTGWVTVEQYGAVADGVTDCSEAFRQAFLSGYKVTCAPTHVNRTYKFTKKIECGSLTTRQLVFDGSDCTFSGFCMFLNIKGTESDEEDGIRVCDWKDIYRWKGMIVQNCTFTSMGSTWGDAKYGKQWFTPCFISGMPMSFENITLDYQYVLLAYIDRYIDKLYCRNIHLVSEDNKKAGHTVANLGNYAMIMRIKSDWNLVKVGTTEDWNEHQPSAGDGWIFEECNEVRQWSTRADEDGSLDGKDGKGQIVADYQDSKYCIAVANTSLPMTFRQCINSSIGWAETDASTYTKSPMLSCYGCHFEEGGVICLDDKAEFTHKAMMLFDSCYFYGGCKRPYHKQVTYLSCYFRVDLNMSGTTNICNAVKQNKQNITQPCRFINCSYSQNDSTLDSTWWYKELGANYSDSSLNLSVGIAKNYETGVLYTHGNNSCVETGTWSVTAIIRNFEDAKTAYFKDTKTVTLSNVTNILEINISGVVGNQIFEFYATSPSGVIYKSTHKMHGYFNGTSVWFHTRYATWSCNGSQNPIGRHIHAISPYADSLETVSNIPATYVNSNLYKLSPGLLLYKGEDTNAVSIGGYITMTNKSLGINYVYDKESTANPVNVYNESYVIK